MSKKWTVSHDALKADAVYNSKLVTKFINCMMKGGKKSVSQRVFYDAMKLVSAKVQDKEPSAVFEAAINNVKPMFEVRSKRVGGSSYQVPMQVKPNRQQSLAIRWVLEASRGKKGKPMSERLASEVIDAYNQQGSAIMMRENIHKMAEANKAFAHFAW